MADYPRSNTRHRFCVFIGCAKRITYFKIISIYIQGNSTFNFQIQMRFRSVNDHNSETCSFHKVRVGVIILI